MLVRHGLTGTRDRGIEPGDFGARAIWMLHDFTHLTDLVLYLIERARVGELNDVQSLRLQKLACRALVEQPDDDNVELERHHVFDPTLQSQITACTTGRSELLGIAGLPA